MAHNPRGGWRFLDGPEQAARGAEAPPPNLAHAVASPDLEAPDVREERLRFAGDDQRPPQGRPGTGTQGTWHVDPESACAPDRRTSVEPASPRRASVGKPS